MINVHRKWSLLHLKEEDFALINTKYLLEKNVNMKILKAKMIAMLILNNLIAKEFQKKDVLPWTFISQNQAALVCAKLGKRLPSNKEWLMAAFGTPDPSSNWTKDDCNVSGNRSQNPGYTGSGEKCVSSFGAFDMIGNVWEWVDGTISDGKYRGQDLPESGFILSVDDRALPSETDPDNYNKYYYNDYFWIKKNGVKGMARGGYWGNKDEAGQYSVYAVSKPNYVGKGIGFRCVK